MKNTFVISAFPGCGKSYCFRNYQDTVSMLDSDSSEFSWVKNSEGNNTKERNPEFPDNYIKHIKDNIGKVDIIFVSSHDVVRKAILENEINAILVYPNKDLKDEWIRRFKERGNNEGFINFISANWDNFIEDLRNEPTPKYFEYHKESNGFYHKELKNTDSYITLEWLCSITDNSTGNLSSLWAN